MGAHKIRLWTRPEPSDRRIDRSFGATITATSNWGIERGACELPAFTEDERCACW